MPLPAEATMIRMQLVGSALALLLAATLVSEADAQAAQAGRKTPKTTKVARKPAGPSGPMIGIEPRAVDLLKAASARLAAARTMTDHGRG
jgi:hypothetical protein